MALLPLSTLAQIQEANTLQLTGVSEVEIVPDMFRFDLRFTVTTNKMKKSVDSLNDAMERMIRAITRNTDIKSDSIKTLGFNTYVNDNRYEPKKRKTTYTANQSLQLKIPANTEDIVHLLNVITEANAGVNIQTNSYFSNEKKAAVEEQLINKAFDNARHQADMLAKAGNFKVGNVRSVNYSQGIPFQVRANYRAEALQMSAKADNSFGDFNLAGQRISKRIDISFYIYPKEN